MSIRRALVWVVITYTALVAQAPVLHIDRSEELV